MPLLLTPTKVNAMAAMIGGVAASRAVAKVDSKLSAQILRPVRQIVGEVGGEEARVDAVRGRVRATKRVN